MKDYSTDLTEVLAEMAEVPVTDDAVDEAKTDSELFEEIQDYYPMLPQADMALVKHLERLIRKYPDEAKIQNHLAIAYQNMGKTRKSNQITRKIFRDFPDYLFARVNEVGFLLNEDRTDEVLELLGPSLRLRDLQPETAVFHLSEFRSFYHAVADYHSSCDRDELADGIAKYLLDFHPAPHPPLENLRRRIELKRMQKNLTRMADEKKRIIRVREGKEERNLSKELPNLRHGELEILYRLRI